MASTKKLSNYTHARYCCDISDLMAGIDEIRQAIDIRKIISKQTPYYYGVRLTKLKNKLNKLTNKTIMEAKSIKDDNNFYFNLDGHGKQFMGSFESAIRDAYKKGSTGNQAKLEIAFPDYFKFYSSIK